MKKIGLITINDINNYGNRLQNYALQKYLSNLNFSVENIVDNTYYDLYPPKSIKRAIKDMIFFSKTERFRNFKKFNKLIKYSKYCVNNNCYNIQLNENYDYFCVGSDQVWNPDFAVSRVMLLQNSPYEKNLAYAASFGVENIPLNMERFYKNGLSNIKYISVREDKGKNIVDKLLNDNKSCVLIDPTMLLSDDEWSEISKKPKNLKTDKFILNYFLGNLSEKKQREIEKVAKDNNCEIINLLDKKSKYYSCGPKEFLYLEKNAFLICTDSFHSSVFALIFDRPFVIYDREDSKVGNMNSRLDTLISKFKLKNRKFNGSNITSENLEHDYTEAYKILEEERKKSYDFLRKALDIKDSDKKNG